MIEIYGKTYQPLPKTLPETPETGINGYFKKTRSGIFFYDLEGQECTCIRKDGLGPVSTTHVDGKRFFMHSHTTPHGDWMGVPDSYMAQCNGARDLARSLFPGA